MTGSAGDAVAVIAETDVNWLMFTTGAFIVATAVLDALWTTIAFSGGGPITRRLARWAWMTVLTFHRRDSSRSHALLKITGTIILLAVVVVWIVMLLGGYLLMFSAARDAVVQSSSRNPADLAQRFYFVGYTLFTMGNGDYVPATDGWRVLTVFATINGLFLVTLAITYLLPVVSATAQKRQLAAAISDLGLSAPEIVSRAWDGRGFEGITGYLPQIGQMIDLHAQRHLAYPVLGYFHSSTRRTAVAPSMAVLQDALLILSLGVPESVRLRPIALEPARRALQGLLDLLRDRYIGLDRGLPPPPDLAALRRAGIPVLSDEAFATALGDWEEVRRLFHSYVLFSGWGSGGTSVPEPKPGSPVRRPAFSRPINNQVQ